MPRINFEVTEEEKALLDQAAASEHMQATAWARSFVLRGANQIVAQQVNKELVALMKAMGNFDMDVLKESNEIAKQQLEVYGSQMLLDDSE